MKLFKNKKGSQLVEKIMMAAFAVAAGAAVVVYTSNVIIEAKNMQITGVLQEQQERIHLTADDMVEGKRYQFSFLPDSGYSQELNGKLGWGSIYFSDYYCDGHTYEQHNGSFPVYTNQDGYYSLVLSPYGNFDFNSQYGPSWTIAENLRPKFQFTYQGYSGDVTAIFDYLIEI